MRALFVLPVFVVLICIFSTQDAHATTFTATTTGEWSNPTTWGGSSPPIVINPGDTVTIPSGITVTISFGGIISNHGAIVNSGTLNNTVGSISNFAMIINNAGGTINNYKPVKIWL